MLVPKAPVLLSLTHISAQRPQFQFFIYLKCSFDLSTDVFIITRMHEVLLLS